MAASKSKNIPVGFTRLAGASGVSSGAGISGISGLAMTDTAGNTWYLWFENDGTLLCGDADTVEAAGYNFNTGTVVVGGQT
jgi:hypothetical protein